MSQALRVLAFCVPIAALHVWMVTVVGLGWPSVVLLPAVLGVVGAVSTFLPEERKAAVKTELGVVLGFGLRTATLVVLWLLVAGVTLSWSAIRVSGDLGGAETLRLGVVRPGKGAAPTRDLASAGDTLVFRRFVWPWGREYDVVSADCPAYPVRVRPWRPPLVRPQQLLASCPLLVVRVPAELHAVLRGGIVSVHLADGRGANVPTNAEQGAASFGRSRKVPDALSARWRAQLEAAGLGGEGMARSLDCWQHPVPGTLPVPVRQGLQLRAEFRNGAGVTMASGAVEIGGEPVTDLLLSTGEARR
jgi:hypothetical protein